MSDATIKVTLSDSEYNLLVKMAERDLRSLPWELRYLLLLEAQRRELIDRRVILDEEVPMATGTHRK